MKYFSSYYRVGPLPAQEDPWVMEVYTDWSRWWVEHLPMLGSSSQKVSQTVSFKSVHWCNDKVLWECPGPFQTISASTGSTDAARLSSPLSMYPWGFLVLRMRGEDMKLPNRITCGLPVKKSRIQLHRCPLSWWHSSVASLSKNPVSTVMVQTQVL